MNEKPILFSGEMVRAIIAGQKTQTRRIIKNQDFFGCFTGDCPHEKQIECDAAIKEWAECNCPYGGTGNKIWVKETYAAPWGIDYKFPNGESGILYRADNPKKFPDDGTWKPSIFCTRKASRITLEIVSVRVEKLDDISDCDVLSEGVESREQYIKLWNKINGNNAWLKNPWIWVLGFRQV